MRIRKTFEASVVGGELRMASPFSKFYYLNQDKLLLIVLLDVIVGRIPCLIMSSIGIWKCEHDCDRRECHHCFSIHEFDRLVEGRFKYFNVPIVNPSKRQHEPDSPDLSHADAFAAHTVPHLRQRRQRYMGDNVDEFHTDGLLQSVPGVLSTHHRHHQSEPKQYHALSNGHTESITTASDDVVRIHDPAADADFRPCDIDYESKSCIE